jgi:phosphatidylglycerophosphate synthase
VRTAVIAVLTGPQPVDGDGLLRSALTGLGVTVITADGPAATARAVASASAAGTVALVDPRLAAHPHALRLALLDPRWEAAHAPGVLTVSGGARELLAAELRAMPDLTGHRVDGFSPAARLTAPKPLLADEFAERLRGQGVAVHETVLPDGLVARLVEEPLSARKDVYAEIAAVDDEAIRLRARSRATTVFSPPTASRPGRPYLARWLAKDGWSPNFVTTMSLLVALAGAAGAATGTRVGYVCTAVALYLSFALDCTDGQLARYALQFSRIGSWLDATFDRVKEYAVYAGLAIGAAHSGHDRGVWLLAASAMVLQTLRHHVDFAYHESLRGQPSATEEKVTAADAPRRSPGYWARKVVVLPIGERWALIAILTALTSPRIVFSVLLIWGLLAARLHHHGPGAAIPARHGVRTESAVDALRAMCDLPLAIKAASREPLTAKLGWLTPADDPARGLRGRARPDRGRRAARRRGLHPAGGRDLPPLRRRLPDPGQRRAAAALALRRARRQPRPLGAGRRPGHGDGLGQRAEHGDLAARRVRRGARGGRVGALLDPARGAGAAGLSRNPRPAQC